MGNLCATYVTTLELGDHFNAFACIVSGDKFGLVLCEIGTGHELPAGARRALEVEKTKTCHGTRNSTCNEKEQEPSPPPHEIKMPSHRSKPKSDGPNSIQREDLLASRTLQNCYRYIPSIAARRGRSLQYRLEGKGAKSDTIWSSPHLKLPRHNEKKKNLRHCCCPYSTDSRRF